jgi:hypothetical protein
MEEIKNCKIHGLTPYIKRKDGRFRCKKCSVIAVQKRRNKIKSLALDYKNNKCEKCGYDKCNAALQFHHIDPKHKNFAIGHKGYTRSWEKVKNELDNCTLLCANCHAELHNCP